MISASVVRLLFIACRISDWLFTGNERDRKQMQDKINNLERNLNASTLERGQLNDRVNKLKQVYIYC